MGFNGTSLMGSNGIYPPVMTKIAIEHGHRNTGFSHEKNVILHGYVKLPEGICPELVVMSHVSTQS